MLGNGGRAYSIMLAAPAERLPVAPDCEWQIGGVGSRRGQDTNQNLRHHARGRCEGGGGRGGGCGGDDFSSRVAAEYCNRSCKRNCSGGWAICDAGGRV